MAAKEVILSGTATVPSEVTVYQLKTILTDEQIKALRSSPVELVPAPGAGKVITPIACRFVINNMAGAYTGVTDAVFQLKLGSLYASAPFLAESILGNIYNASGNLALPYTQLGTGNYDGIVVSAGVGEIYVNEPLMLVDDWMGGSDYGGGNASNTLAFIISYGIADV